MVDSVNPSGSKDPSYHAQYKVSPAFQKFWDNLFHQHISKKDASEMTDQFVKNVWSGMNRVLQHALKAQKELERKRKEHDE